MQQADLGVIETIRVRAARIPFLEQHLARLGRSLEQLGLPPPSRDVRALVMPFQGMGEAVVRADVCEARVTVTVRDLPSLEAPAVITASEPHVAYRHKTTQRDCFNDAAAEALVAEADDALLLTHQGLVAEGTVWNLFWWDGERLCTPPLELGILPGIGRAHLFERAEVKEQPIDRDGLNGKSLFLVNSVRGIVPIASLDGVAIPEDERTPALARQFWP